MDAFLAKETEVDIALTECALHWEVEGPGLEPAEASVMTLLIKKLIAFFERVLLGQRGDTNRVRG